VKSCSLSVLGFQVACSIAALAAPSTVIPDPKPVAEAFCRAEYEGNDASAAEMVTISKVRQAELRKAFHAKHPGEPLPIADMIGGTFYSEPVLVVRSYRIVDQVGQGDTSTAQVEYVVCGEFKSGKDDRCATDFVAYDNKIQKEALKFRFSDGKNGMGWIRHTNWYVEDPPVPKVSVDALLRLCKKQLETFQGTAQRLKERGQAVPPNITWGNETYGRKVKSLESISALPAK